MIVENPFTYVCEPRVLFFTEARTRDTDCGATFEVPAKEEARKNARRAKTRARHSFSNYFFFFLFFCFCFFLFIFYFFFIIFVFVFFFLLSISSCTFTFQFTHSHPYPLISSCENQIRLYAAILMIITWHDLHMHMYKHADRLFLFFIFILYSARRRPRISERRC